ncbi:MAG TPA: DUF3168 domain-containing protein [Allosphingosinicella sp.]|nr:DUF3168 domain-containing protein [Allosphingosinicella sp.]
MSAGQQLQAAAIAALRVAPGIGGVYDGPPLHAAFPFAVVDVGPESEWGHKSGSGREVRLAVTVRDEGERPARLHALMAEAEAAMEGLTSPTGWSMVTMRFVRSRIVRDPKGTWTGVIEYRARMLANASAD